jgi:hypothetical protein
MAWVVGLGLAALIFLVGPDRFMFRLMDTLHVLGWRLAEALAELSATAVDVVRALSIGLYVTFVGLGLAVARRGGRARLALVVVSLLFLMLAGDAGPGDQTRWLAALALSGIAASIMTGRLRQAGALARP